MEIFIILGVIAVVVCAVSLFGYLLLRKGRDITDVCSILAGFWCGVTLSVLVVFSIMLISDFNLYSYPIVVYVLQGTFIESFLCGVFIWIYGLSRDPDCKEAQQELKS